PEELSRLLALFKFWLLAIPHYIVLVFLGLASAVVTFIAFFAILITGKYPEGMWNFVLGVLRWGARVNAYAMLQRDEYPPFSFDGEYPVHLDLQYPTHLNRWMVLIKWLLIIPHSIALWVLGAIAQIVFIIALIAILVTGRYPRQLFDFVTGFGRWSSRVSAYTLFLTDDYPPFSFESDTPYTPPSSAGPTAISYR
ncbi:MAG: DUF4389 domain-containing protein, partial [Thermomicrobiales bacterium]